VGTRVLQVANFYSRHSGGLRTTVDALGRAYVDAGFERVLVVPGPADADEETPAGRRITLRAPKLPGSGGYRALPGTGAVRAVLAELPPDHLEVSDKLTLVGLGPWAARHGVRAVLVSHERLDAILAPRVPPGFPLAVFADWWNRRVARGFAAVVSPSRFAAAEFTRVGAPNVSVVPLGVDLDAFHPRLARERPADAGGDDNEVRLVCVGRLSREKRPHVAIDTLRALSAGGVAARLWMVGDGPRRRALEAQARDIPVVFAGHVHDRRALAALLARADVALAPCPYETFGLAALEALACGTPVVVPDRGALPELVQAGQGAAGAVAAPEPVSLAAAVLDLARRPTDPQRRAARARAEQFPWTRTACDMMRVHRMDPRAYLNFAQRSSDTHDRTR
jgi:alpha-1,6-mannosyltransferase